MSEKVTIKVKSLGKSFVRYGGQFEKLAIQLGLKKPRKEQVFDALRNVSLDFKKGEVVGLVGLNGSGKSTFLKMLSGVMEPTSGSIEVNGKLTALLELRTGFNYDYTGVENIRFYGSLNGISSEIIERRLPEIIEFADIGEFIHYPMKTYSSGMKARVGFAATLLFDPDILILDEVLAVGDASFHRKSFNKVKELMGKGSTVIIVHHNVDTLANVCNRIVFLNKGELVADSSPKEVIEGYKAFCHMLPEEREEFLQGYFKKGGKSNGPWEVVNKRVADESSLDARIVNQCREVTQVLKPFKKYFIQIEDHSVLTKNDVMFVLLSSPEGIPIAREEIDLKLFREHIFPSDGYYDIPLTCRLKKGVYFLTLTFFKVNKEGELRMNKRFFDIIKFDVDDGLKSKGYFLLLDEEIPYKLGGKPVISNRQGSREVRVVNPKGYNS